MAKSKRVGDCSIIVAECFTVREALLVTIKKYIQRIITQRDSQLVGNSINGEICVPKDTINLIEDLRHLLALFSNNGIKYCKKVFNREANVLAKTVHRNFPILSYFSVMNTLIIFTEKKCLHSLNLSVAYNE